ncbi:hypothetical protein GO755_16875 [Spirosoma sp. HMF4905]|uniref:Universal stress protein n=1 Tax=Spirosoma arboris TaxID=2682092 RepID=A0A7K1SD33_9BACT|nr:hypothetical protein [Spirosoma arboris]MVM31724.1 hypothetical protein [Spirosoma arboris]
MKKALLLTDGSIDLALAVNRWVANQPDAIDLTVVYAFALPFDSNQPLKAAAHRAAKQEANANLQQWLNYVSAPWPGKIQTETILGGPELVMRIHLLLRHYDYLLANLEQQEVVIAFAACKNHILTELHSLSLPEDSIGERALYGQGARAYYSKI